MFPHLEHTFLLWVLVFILDTFTSSISNLKQQIEERRKQYEYERDLLLDLEGKAGIPDVALCTSEASAFVFSGTYSVVLKYKPTQLQLDFSVLDSA